MSEKKYSIDDIISEIKENKISEEQLNQYGRDFEKFNTTALLDDILGRSNEEDVLDGIDLKDNGLTPEENAEADRLLAEILAADKEGKKQEISFFAPKTKGKKAPKPLKPLTPVDERPASPLRSNPAMDYAVHMDDMARLLSKEDLEREAKRFRERRGLSSRPFDPHPSKTAEKAEIPPWKGTKEPLKEDQMPEEKPQTDLGVTEIPKEKPLQQKDKGEAQIDQKIPVKEEKFTEEKPKPETDPVVLSDPKKAEKSKEAEEPVRRSDRSEVTTQIYRPVEKKKEPDTIEITGLDHLNKPSDTPLNQEQESPIETELPGQLNLLTNSEVPAQSQTSKRPEVYSTMTEIRVGPVDVANSVSADHQEEEPPKKEALLDDTAQLKYIALRKNRENLVKGFALDPDAVNGENQPDAQPNESLRREIENADISIDTSAPKKKSPLLESPIAVPLEKEDVPLFSAGEGKTSRHIDTQKINGWKDKLSEHIAEEEEDIPDEYTSYRQANDVRDMLSEIGHGFLFRFIGCFIVALLSLGLLWINRSADGAMIALLDIEKNPLFYCLANLALMVLLFAFSFDVIKNGIAAIFKKSPGRMTMYAVAQISLLIYSAVLLTYPEVAAEKNIHVYIPLLAVCMMLLYRGRMLGIKRIIKNFALVSEQSDKYATDIVDNQELAEDLTKGALNDYPFLACSRKTPFLSDFLNESFSEDITDKHAKYVLGVVCSIAVIVAVAALFRGSDLYGALTALTGVLVVGAGASAMFVVNVPLWRASKQLSRVGGAVLGYNAVDTYRDVNSVLVSANDLFGKEDVTLYGIKTFSNMAIDRAILDATSVLCETKSILGRIFMKIISDRTDYLDPVDTVIYEDGMGISAWVKNRRVLIGSRELMINHNIDVPSRDYEQRYIAQDRNLIYLSAAGELSAVFVVGLSCSDEIRNMLVDLYNDEIAVIVKSVDPILTREQLAKVFEMPEDAFRVIPSRLHKECEQLADEQRPVNGAVINDGSFASYIASVLMAKRLNKAVSAAQLVNFVSIGVGVLLFVAFTAMESVSQLNNFVLCGYEVAFALLTALAQRVKKLMP